MPNKEKELSMRKKSVEFIGFEAVPFQKNDPKTRALAMKAKLISVVKVVPSGNTYRHLMTAKFPFNLVMALTTLSSQKAQTLVEKRVNGFGFRKEYAVVEKLKEAVEELTVRA